MLRPSLFRDTVGDMNPLTTTAHDPSLAIRDAIAAEVRAAIARDGRKAADIAAMTGISTSALSRKLKGLAPFWVDELLSIAAVLNVDPGTLIKASA